MEYQPQEGVDYVVDLYAVIGVPRDTEEPAIKRSIHERMLEYHPDRLEGLAPELRARGADVALILNRANVILLDAEKRQEYDEILNEWTGPISQDGRPIIRLDRALQAEFQGKTPEEVEEILSVQAEKIAIVLGYSPARLTFLEKLVQEADGDISDDLRAEYEAALLQKDQVLAIQEAERSKLLGLPDIEEEKYATQENYAALIDARINTARKEREEELQRLAIGSAATRLALLAGEEVGGQGGELTNGVSAFELPAYFDSQADKIREIAKEREELLDERLGNFTLFYPMAENQPDFAGKLALGIRGSEETTWIGVEVDEENHANGSILPEDIESLLADEDFYQVIRQGYNIATLNLMEQVDLRDLVRVATAKYVDKFQQTQAQTEV